MKPFLNNMSIGVIVLGIFIISWGIVWLGNEMGFWRVNFPFWPVIVILVGVMILLHEFKKGI